MSHNDFRCESRRRFSLMKNLTHPEVCRTLLVLGLVRGAAIVRLIDVSNPPI